MNLSEEFMAAADIEANTPITVGVGTAKDDIFKIYREAVCLTRVVGGKTQYRISPHPLRNETDIPYKGFLSSWCQSEERAWKAAVSRHWNKVYSVDHW